jgi:hypothetical protein
VLQWEELDGEEICGAKVNTNGEARKDLRNSMIAEIPSERIRGQSNAPHDFDERVAEEEGKVSDIRVLTARKPRRLPMQSVLHIRRV